MVGGWIKCEQARGDVEMGVPAEGGGSDGMLVSLCPSKCGNSGEGR